jgi:hypothetical protein
MSRAVGLPVRRSSPAGFPGDRRVAERAEQVVAQLERLAHRGAISLVGGVDLHRVGLGRAGQRQPELQRPPHRVARRLVPGDQQRPLHRPAAGPGLAEHVEILPGDRLDTHLVVAGAGLEQGAGRQRRAGKQLIRPDHAEIADEDGRRCAEMLGIAPAPGARVLGREDAVRGRPAAAGGGMVHDVVVDQGERVQQLERAERREHC